MVNVIGAVAIGLIGLATLIAVYLLARSQPSEAPELGDRGLKRHQALAQGSAFRLVEPIMRFVAGLIGPLPLFNVRKKIESLLRHSGHFLGLTADEYMALTLLSGGSLLGLGVFAIQTVSLNPLLVVFAAVLGGLFPYMHVNSEVQRRFKEVNRSLPAAIDLAALCMGAGLDFPGALRQITNTSSAAEDSLNDEFRRILRELELGRTRQQALAAFAERVPTEAVKDFVAAVVQAEQKGSPLAEILRIQANMLRMRRSVTAEEAAARAAVFMMAPLMLIFAAIILLLMGPFIVNSMTNSI